MRVIVKKWGNGAALRIPAAIMSAANICLDQAVEVHEEHGRIVIEAVRRKAYKLDDLLGSITGKNLHQPVAMGAPVGKEVW
jgi:antitoxin MazE